MHDSIKAERLGIPSVAIMTDRFKRSAQLVAELNGLPAYPFAVIDHPIANDDDDALRAKAEIALTQIVSFLLERQGAEASAAPRGRGGSSIESKGKNA